MDFVLSKPELIEAILLQLPMKDLLIHAQLVNKDFYSIITQFPSLQRKLFFVAKPVIIPGISRGSNAPGPEDWEINPLLRESFPPWFLNHASMPGQFEQSGISELRKLDWTSSTEKTAAYARREASWRRMLVTQPPIRSLGIVKSASTQGGTFENTGKIILESGIKMGLMFDLVEMHMISCSPVSSFALQWHIILDKDQKEDVLEEEKMENHVTLYLSYTVQCAIGTMGRGFRAEDPKGRDPIYGRGRPIRRIPSVIEPWRFHSEGYKHVKVNFQKTPQHIIGM